MKPTEEYIKQARACLEGIFRAKRGEILNAHGKIDIDYKADKSVVTDMDRAFELEIKAALKRLDTGVGFEGEEHGVEGSRETYWLIDPIDGTESFVRGLPFVRNMATLVDHGEPVFAVVYRPVFDEMLVGIKGKGVTSNGTSVHVSNRPLERSWIELHTHLTEPSARKAVEEIGSKILGFRISDFCYVVDGRMDGQIMYKSGGGPWDYAPRGFLIAEAGGCVANVGSDSFDFRNKDILATNPVIFEEVMKILTLADSIK